MGFGIRERGLVREFIRPKENVPYLKYRGSPSTEKSRLSRAFFISSTLVFSSSNVTVAICDL